MVKFVLRVMKNILVSMVLVKKELYRITKNIVELGSVIELLDNHV